MARFGLEPGERGSLEERNLPDGSVEGYFVPNPKISSNGRHVDPVLILRAEPSQQALTMYPLDTRHWRDSYLGPKYTQIRMITVPLERDDSPALIDELESLPFGFTKDYEYGLGFARVLGSFVDLVEQNTRCTSIIFTHGSGAQVGDTTLNMGLEAFGELVAELNRVGSRGQAAIKRVREATSHNALADSLGLSVKVPALGRAPGSKLMTRVAAGEEVLTDEEVSELAHETSRNLGQLASSEPKQLVRLQRDVESVALDELVRMMKSALDVGHTEAWWQGFFEENTFALQMVFGGPSVFVGSQTIVGDESPGTGGKRILDYLYRNTVTGNAAIVEIKRPMTKLVKERQFRKGIHGVSAGLSDAVSQVLDQARCLVEYTEHTRERAGDSQLQTPAPRCFVLAGLTTQLDTAEMKRSFELYRQGVANVTIVAFDELLGQIEHLRDYLRGDADWEILRPQAGNQTQGDSP